MQTMLDTLTWMCGHTRLDKIRNEHVCNLQATHVEDKIREGYLRWFGHVLRRPLAALISWCETPVIECETS